MKVAKRRKSANGALFAALAALLFAGAAFGSAEETTPVPRQSEDTWGWDGGDCPQLRWCFWLENDEILQDNANGGENDGKDGFACDVQIASAF